MGGKRRKKVLYARSYDGGVIRKATSPPQELEVGARRAPYLLVTIYFLNRLYEFTCLVSHFLSKACMKLYSRNFRFFKYYIVFY